MFGSFWNFCCGTRDHPERDQENLIPITVANIKVKQVVKERKPKSVVINPNLQPSQKIQKERYLADLEFQLKTIEA